MPWFPSSLRTPFSPKAHAFPRQSGHLLRPLPSPQVCSFMAHGYPQRDPRHVPLIMPLSTGAAPEATAADILAWTDGKASGT